jgi:hypothetical protein
MLIAISSTFSRISIIDPSAFRVSELHTLNKVRTTLTRSGSFRISMGLPRNLTVRSSLPTRVAILACHEGRRLKGRKSASTS